MVATFAMHLHTYSNCIFKSWCNFISHCLSKFRGFDRSQISRVSLLSSDYQETKDLSLVPHSITKLCRNSHKTAINRSNSPGVKHSCLQLEKWSVLLWKGRSRTYDFANNDKQQHRFLPISHSYTGERRRNDVTTTVINQLSQSQNHPVIRW